MQHISARVRPSASSSRRLFWKAASGDAPAARKQLPSLARALERSRNKPYLHRGALMQVWASIRLGDQRNAEAASVLLNDHLLDSRVPCRVLAAWAEALAAVPRSRDAAANQVWESLADIVVKAIEGKRSMLRWFSQDSGCSLEDIARIACAFAVAMPGAEASLRVASASAAAVSAAKSAHPRSTAKSSDEWRRIAWACAVAGDPNEAVFGTPDIDASAEVSQAVWQGLGRLRSHTLTESPFPVVWLPSWLPSDVSRTLLDAADSGNLWEPSPLAAPSGRLPVRTSRSAVLAQSRGLSADVLKAAVTAQKGAADLFGLPVSHMEPPQLVCYSPGEFYAPHVDWGRPEDVTLWLSGQRVATVLVYLNDLTSECGGATYFSQLGLQVFPERGAALVWPNVSALGEPLSETEHEAQPLLAKACSEVGQTRRKVAMNLWARDRPAPGPW